MPKSSQNSSMVPPESLLCPVCAALHVPVQGSLKEGIYAADCVNCGHSFRFKAKPLGDAASSISFKINGKTVTVGNEYPASRPLLSYLRGTRISVGTKGMCWQGGCGACMVSIKFWHPLQKTNVDIAVNACQLPLYACDGHEITTIEGLGNVQDGLHPIQDRMAKRDGIQCGYCTPGQVMNMFGILKENPRPTMEHVEDMMDSTICRCTGYRPILDAMKSFAVDADPKLKGGVIDIEDLEAKLCKKDGKPCSGHCSSYTTCTNHVTSGGEEEMGHRRLHVVSSGPTWLKPTTTQELCKLLATYKDSSYRLVFGGTAAGFFGDLAIGKFQTLIDVRGIDELYKIDVQGSNGIQLGANLSLNVLQQFFANNKDKATMPYASQFAEHLKYVALNGIRNQACWAGNVMMKKVHPEFVSDVFTLLSCVGAKLVIKNDDQSVAHYTMSGFRDSLDMKGRVIMYMILPTLSSKVKVRTYRTGVRLQACLSSVVSGFMFEVDESNGYLVSGRPSITYDGINNDFTHAFKTEDYIVGKKLADPTVFKQALTILASEINPTKTAETQEGIYFRKNLALGMFYRCCLDLCSSSVDVRYLSGGQPIVRPPMVGTQDPGPTFKKEWPLTESMPKSIAGYLASGAPAFLADKEPTPNQLTAVILLSEVGNCTLKTLDATAALALPGVHAFLTYKDIPAGGINNWRPQGIQPGYKQELLCSGYIAYAGQALGAVVADNRSICNQAISLIKVEYSDRKHVVTDIREAVRRKMFYPDQATPVKVGDPIGAIKKAPRKIKGNILCAEQYHFYMEMNVSVCTPLDTGGMHIGGSTQWIDGVSELVGQVLNVPESDLTVEVERLGGAFGGKICQNFPVSAICALAAHVTKRPVKLRMDLKRTMEMLGKRFPNLGDYEVGVDETGKLEGINVTMYEDCGDSNAETLVALSIGHIDNAYYCPNWLYTPITVKTHKAANTAMRCPVAIPATFVIETIMDHVAKELNLDPMNVRKRNLYVKDQMSPSGEKLDRCNIREVVSQLEADTKMEQRKQEVAAFNKANRWKKRGLALTPNRWGCSWYGGRYTTAVTIFHGDGSVAITHGGIDCGQGINTKLIQVCAYEFKIPMDKIRIKKTSSVTNANSYTTGGSITSELAALGLLGCIKILKARMAPVKAQMKNPTWQQLVSECIGKQIDLVASYMTHPDSYQKEENLYSNYSAGLVEAEIDVLTGQYQIRQSDMLFDCGKSMNPELDMGQAEGAMVIGIGYLMQEEIKYDKTTGKVINHDTTHYKPPFAKDIPLKYNFKFLRNSNNPLGVLDSKTSGEPPLNMAMGAFLAIKHAVEAAREENGQTGYFPLSSPATVDRLQSLCRNDVSKFQYKPSSSLTTNNTTASPSPRHNMVHKACYEYVPNY